MGESLRIKRLERLWGDARPVCPHAFSLIVDGEMVQDDPACACGGERITVIAAHEGESLPESGGGAGTKAAHQTAGTCRE